MKPVLFQYKPDDNDRDFGYKYEMISKTDSLNETEHTIIFNLGQ